LFAYFDLGEKDGYAGIGLYSKKEPIKVTYGVGNKEFDAEGRVITAEYENFYFVAACKYLLTFIYIYYKELHVLQGFTNPSCQVAVMMEFFMVVPRGSSSIRAVDLPEILRNIKLNTVES
jgi:hypothetical protein